MQFRRPRFDPWVRKICWRKEWLPTPVFLPGKFHERRNLVGYSLQSHKELDMTEWITLSLLPVCTTNLYNLLPSLIYHWNNFTLFYVILWASKYMGNYTYIHKFFVCVYIFILYISISIIYSDILNRIILYIWFIYEFLPYFLCIYITKNIYIYI